MLAELRNKLRLLLQVFASARHRGLRRTLRIAGYELWYNRKFAAETASIIHAGELDFAEDAKTHAQDYFPSSYLFMAEAFRAEPLRRPGRVLVDFGCGKGRALLFASTLPFDKIIGVELSPTLCRAARDNLARYYAREGKRAPEWSVVNADVRDFEIPDEADVFYFFNPFDAHVLGIVLERIAVSLRRAPREAFIVYLKPLHAASIEARGWTKLPAAGTDFALFRNGGAA
jgi:SAM-dependent methyltransferase